MSGGFGWRAAAALLVCGLPGACVQADEAGGEASPTMRKTAERLHFQVPEDWPVEKRGGVMAPIPIEEYLARKFKALDGRLHMIENTVNSVEIRLRVLEERAQQAKQGLVSSETGPQP